MVLTCSLNVEYVKSVAKTIFYQILAGGSFYCVGSWGIEKKCFLEVDHNAALLLKVNGFIHTGYVLIVLNSSDLYDIYLSKTMNLDSFKLAIDDVYCDQLTEIIDSLIERGNMSDKDYNEKVKIWFKEL